MRRQAGLFAVWWLLLMPGVEASDTLAPSTPTGLLVLSFSPSSLRAQWNGSGDDIGVTGYRLDVATDPGFSSLSLVLGYNNKDVGNVTAVKITGLAPSTTYYARVRAYDAAGNVSMNSTTGDGRTKSVPSYPVADFVKTGSLHWSHAAGDPTLDDTPDFDNSFGDHNGTMTNPGGNLSPEYVFLGPLNSNMQFDMSTPSGGTYIFSMVIGLAIGYPVRVATCPGANCPSGLWTDLTPDAIETVKPSQVERQFSWTLTIPGGQPITRFRLTAVTTGGARKMEWAVLKHQVSSFFSSPPTDATTHPRLMFTASELATLQTAVTVPGTLKTLYTGMVTRCTNFTPPSDSKWTTLDNAFETHDFALVLLTCSVAAGISRTPALVTKAIGYLTDTAGLPINRSCSNSSPPGGQPPQACTASSWMVDEQLDQANILSAFAIAFDIMYNDLTPTQRQTFSDKLAFEADIMETASHVGWFWSRDDRGNNKTAANLDALGLPGLALDHGLTTASYTSYATSLMLVHLDTYFDPDGGAGEPSGYYTFANDRFVEYATALRRSGGFDLFAYHNGVFGQSSEWLLDMMVPDTLMQAPLGDTNREPVAPWSLTALLHEYHNGYTRWMFDHLYPDANALNALIQGNYRSRSSYQTVLFYDESTAAVSPDGVLPLSRVYNVPMPVTAGGGYTPGNSGYVFARTSFGSKDGLYLATQCGDDEAFHGHADHGSLFLSAYRQNLVDDFTTVGSYGDPSQAWHSSDQGHNALFIDGRAETHEGSDFANLCSVMTFSHPSFLSFTSMNPAAAYGYNSYNPVQYVKRHTLFVPTSTDRGYVVVMDDVNKDGAPHTYKQRWIGYRETPPTFSIVAPGHYLESSVNANLDIFVAEPPAALQTPTLGTQSWGGLYTTKYVDIDSTQARGMYVTLLFPTSTRLGVALPTVTTVRDAAMSGFTLNTDTILFNRLGGLQTSANVSSDGTVLFVRGSSTVDKFLATNATSFSYQGIQYFSAPQAPASVAVEYTANGLTAEVDMGAATTLTLRLASPPQAVQFNGQTVPFTAASGMVTVNNLIGRGTLAVGASTSAIPGDLDGNSVVDVLDLQRMVNVLLGLETDQAVIARADLDGVGGPTILDLQRLVNVLLGV